MRRTLTVAYCLFIVMSLISVSAVSLDGLGADPVQGWGNALPIELVTTHPFHPQVAVDGLGNAVAVWSQDDGYALSLWSNRYVVREGWGTAELIETNNSGDADEPLVAVDGSGNAVVVWCQWNETGPNVWSNRYVVGEGWGTAQMIETSERTTIYPRVAVDSSGSAIAVWCQDDGISHYNIWSNRFVPGAGWGAPELAQTDSAWHAEGPQVAVDMRGNATAVWRQSDGVRDNIWSNRYVVGTGWGTAEMIEDQDGYVLYPQVSVSGSGDAVSVWVQHDGVRESLWSNRYIVGEGWGTAELVELDDDSNVYEPRVVVDGSGNATVVWIQYVGGELNLWSKRYVAGEGWGAAEVIEAQTWDAWSPQVAVDPSGNVTAVWFQGDSLLGSIWSNRYVVGTGWGDAEMIEFGAGDADVPDVAVDQSGDAVAVWSQYDGSRYRVWSNRYLAPDSTPPSLSIESPSDGFTTEAPTVTVSGYTEPGADLVLGGLSVAVGSDGSFSCVVALVEGMNTITAVATDESGNSALVSVSGTFTDPAGALEEQLAAALEALADTQETLDAALAELEALQAQLDDALANVTDVQWQLDAAEEDLAAVQDLLDVATEDLAAVQAQLAGALGEVDILQAQLHNALVNLTVAEDELNDILSDIATAQEELDLVQDELAGTNDDLDDARAQILLLVVALVVAAATAAVMAVMYMRGRGRTGDQDGGAEGD